MERVVMSRNALRAHSDKDILGPSFEVISVGFTVDIPQGEPQLKDQVNEIFGESLTSSYAHEHLYLSVKNNVQQRAYQVIVASLALNPYITRLTWSEENPNMSSVSALCSGMQRNTHISHFELYLQSDLEGKDAGVLFERLLNYPSLSKMVIGLYSLTSEASRYLKRYLQSGIALSTLHIRSGDKRNLVVPLPTVVCKEFFQLKSRLTHLDLCGNKLTNEGCSYISQYIRDEECLRTLSLNYNEIVDTGAISIAESLLYNISITDLDLRFNRFSTAVCYHFVKAICENSILRKVALFEMYTLAGGKETTAQKEINDLLWEKISNDEIAVTQIIETIKMQHMAEECEIKN